MVLKSKHKAVIIQQLIVLMIPLRLYELSHLSEMTLNIKYHWKYGTKSKQLTNTQIGKLITPFWNIHKIVADNRVFYVKIPSLLKNKLITSKKNIQIIIEIIKIMKPLKIYELKQLSEMTSNLNAKRLSNTQINKLITQFWYIYKHKIGNKVFYFKIFTIK